MNRRSYITIILIIFPSLFIAAIGTKQFFTISPVRAESDADWYMSGANPNRTSWISEEVDTNLNVEWYRPIEAYIPQHFQLITVNNLIYVATANGLYALRAENGDLAWRFDTEMPMGNSPTVFEGKVYIGNFDKKLYVLDAANGSLLWSFDGAVAGYSVNPIVIRDSYTNNQPIILTGNRDGNFYAIGGHGHPQQGQVLWKYSMPNNSPIQMSAAYKEGIVYTTAMNNRLYALRVNTSNPSGSLVWQTEPFMGDTFAAYWPVIYRDKVIVVKSSDITDGLRPGGSSLTSPTGTRYGTFNAAETADIGALSPDGSIGERISSLPWSGGYDVTNSRYALEYLEEPTPEEIQNDPAGLNRHNHKPWRREYYVINQSDGKEFTFDSDGDGLKEYIPVLYWRAESGPMYPPVVGPNNIAYITARYLRGYVMGWNIDQPQYLSFPDSTSFALDEPAGLSMGGNRINVSLCCDRPAHSFSANSAQPIRTYWSYTLDGSGKAPGYDEMWQLFPVNISRHQATYVGAMDWYGTSDDGVKTTNASFHSHGVQNPLIPHQGRKFIHRSNAIIALGPGTPQGKKSYLPIQEVQTPVRTLNLNSLLDTEINKMIDAGHLKPGYHVQNQFSLTLYGSLPHYFAFPADTLMVLSMAYPHLSDQTKNRLSTYIREEWDMYFYPTAYATRGWADGVARHPIPLAPEVSSDFNNLQKSAQASGHIWQYPQQGIYGMWKYALNVPESQRPSIQQIYSVAKSKIQVPATSDPTWMQRKPYEINAWIAGYYGFLELYKLAGSPTADSTLKNSVQSEYDRLLEWRASAFTKESWAYPDMQVQHKLDTTRNFIWLTPELADHLENSILEKVNEALDEYLYLNPYWFVSRFENDLGESTNQTLYNYHALFLANAWIKNEPQEQLIKYLDAPAFERGDLFYIQNLITTIEAPGDGNQPAPTPSSSPTPPPVPGDANNDGKVDGLDYVVWLTHYNTNASGAQNGDFNNNGRVDGLDYVIWLNNYTN